MPGGPEEFCDLLSQASLLTGLAAGQAQSTAEGPVDGFTVPAERVHVARTNVTRSGESGIDLDLDAATGMTWFMDLDPVGTVRTITNGSGQFAQACTSLPFGDDQACSPAISDPSPLHFTGKPRDPETGLDYFGFRYNSSTLGRFLTPDPAGNRVANPANPQSWNQYTYVLNNPVTLIDPTGLLYCKPD